MRAVGILMVIASLPAFMVMLNMGARYRTYAFFALGALPILSTGFNVDASFYVLYAWKGHTHGIVVSLADTLALAILLHYAKVKISPVFMAVWGIYVLFHVPGVFVNGYTTASFSYLWNLMRGALYFAACYVVLQKGGMRPLISGLALSIIANGAVTIQNSLGGQGQAAGMIGHRNYSGLVTNLAVPVLMVAVLTWKKARLPALALLFAAMPAMLGGSRGTLVLFVVTVALTLGLMLLIKPNKRTITFAVSAALGAVVLLPVGISTMNQRFAEVGGSFGFTEDGERLAFRRASALMNRDYPLGVGLNQYAVLSNVGGYAVEGGVAWTTAARSAIVHNSYVLTRTEGGHIALFGLFILLGSLIVVSAYLAMRNRANPGRLYAAAVLVAISVMAVHLNYEWVLAGMNTIYAIAFSSALTASALTATQGVSRATAQFGKRPPRRLLADT